MILSKSILFKVCFSILSKAMLWRRLSLIEACKYVSMSFSLLNEPYSDWSDRWTYISSGSTNSRFTSVWIFLEVLLCSTGRFVRKLGNFSDFCVSCSCFAFLFLYCAPLSFRLEMLDAFGFPMKQRNNWAGNRTAVTSSCAVDQTGSS